MQNSRDAHDFVDEQDDALELLALIAALIP